MPAAKAKTESTVITGSIDGFTPPPKPERANAAKYPFADLDVGEFFGVVDKSKRQMASPVANANRKYRSEAKDAEGNVVSSNQEREFYAVDVDAATKKKIKDSVYEAASVLIVRSK